MGRPKGLVPNACGKTSMVGRGILQERDDLGKNVGEFRVSSFGMR